LIKMNTARTIKRDRWGVVRIEGADLTGVYRGLGYAHARDRALQMIFMRLLGRGRVARLQSSSESA
jgi:penicillin amidase